MARFNLTMSSSARRPISAPISVLETVFILSTIKRHGARRPFASLGSIHKQHDVTRHIRNSRLIAKPWVILDDVLKANAGGKSMFHLIWYVLIGLISGVIAKSVMHVHMTIFWTIMLGIIGSIHRRLRYPHVFAPGKRSISSRRPHFLHTRRDPGSLHLL